MTFSPEIGEHSAELLTRVNPTLNPLELSELFPEYKSFYPHRKGYGLWSSLISLPQVITNYMQQDKVVLAISGVAAGGKDAIRETIERLHPGLSFKAVTATSRAPREDEAHAVDYYFYKDVEAFMQAVERDELVEYVIQGDRRYGMPKQSLLDAVDRPEPVITTHVEMEKGWPAISELVDSGFFGNKRVFPIKAFVLPNMRWTEYANEWLPNRRDDVQTRLQRAAWEISQAASFADFFVTNTIGETMTPLEWETNALTNHCVLLLQDQVARQHGLSQTPFEIAPWGGKPEDILVYHSNMLP